MGVQGTVNGDGGLTLPAPAGPMTSTPNLDIVNRESGVGGGMSFVKVAAAAWLGGEVGEAEEGLFCLLAMRS